MFTKKRGRPPGPTAEGRATRERLFREATALIRARGYEAATLRNVAKRARVSPGLLYRYFPSKRAVVLELHGRLSAEFAGRVRLRPGRWTDRALRALRASLAVLRPHRDVLASLLPVLAGEGDDGVFATRTAVSRVRVHGVFAEAVAGAADAPDSRLAEALGRCLYVAHLAVLMFWLLDRSPRQRATARLVARAAALLGWAPFALRWPGARRIVLDLDRLLGQALWRDD